MIIKLIIAYPWWFISFVLLLGFAYASILYLGAKKSKLSPLWRIILFVFRFSSVSILAFLLLSPYILTKIKHSQKPIVIIGQDNSRSMIKQSDSTYIKGEFQVDLDSLKAVLENHYDVESYVFGDEIKYETLADYGDEASDYAGFLALVKENYAGFNVGALIVSGDGNYNKGIDPVFMASGLEFPIFTIALGDTNRHKDIEINDIRHNSIAYLNDHIPVEVTVSAEQLQGEKARIKLTAFGKTWGLETFSIDNSHFIQSFTFLLQPNKTGKQRIRLDIECLNPDNSLLNETASVFVDVLNNRQKLMVLANGPHPDIGAIKASLENYSQYEIEIAYASKLPDHIGDYELIILHQLPSTKYRLPAFMNLLRSSGLPSLFILGQQTDLTAVNKELSGINLQTTSRSYGEARFAYNPAFTSFGLDEELIFTLENMPPLKIPLGNHLTARDMEFLAHQKINQINTGFPLFSFHNGDKRKEGLIMGEGLWLWRIHNYLQTGDHKAFDQLMGKTVQYLLSRKDKRLFRVVTDGTYSSSEHINIQAELYNPSHEAVLGADINFILTNENNESFSYQFSSSGTTYNLEMGFLRPGVYQYEATTQYGSNTHSAGGEFVVQYTSLEQRNLQANHALLYRLASQKNGEMVYAHNMGSIYSLLKDQSQIKSRVYFEELFSSLHTSVLILLIIVILLSIEWFLRKYLGGY